MAYKHGKLVNYLADYPEVVPLAIMESSYILNTLTLDTGQSTKQKPFQTTANSNDQYILKW